MVATDCTLLVDTGADISLFKRNKINPNQIINQANLCTMKGITNGFTKSLGTTNTTLSINGEEIECQFHIVDNNFPIPSDGILGRDFLYK